MKQKTDKSTIGLIICGSLLGLAGVLCVGILALNALSDTIKVHADGLYDKQMALLEKYEKSVDAANIEISTATRKSNAEVKSINDSGAVSSEGEQASVFAPLVAAGIDSANIVKGADGIRVYMIQPGDTLTKISAALGYSVDELANYNGIRDVNLIYANSALRIPKGD